MKICKRVALFVFVSPLGSPWDKLPVMSGWWKSWNSRLPKSSPKQVISGPDPFYSFNSISPRDHLTIRTNVLFASEKGVSDENSFCQKINFDDQISRRTFFTSRNDGLVISECDWYSPTHRIHVYVVYLPTFAIKINQMSVNIPVPWIRYLAIPCDLFGMVVKVIHSKVVNVTFK